jgi:hypothetical protein
MATGLDCQRLDPAAGGAGRWTQIAWRDVLADFDAPMATIVYVHGNRVECGEDKAEGLSFYRAMAHRRAGGAPMRFIVWSWPSGKVPGLVRAYQVKAARTRLVSWQLAWAIDETPADAPVALVGYSYGARVVTGALHLIAGGQLSGLQLQTGGRTDSRPLRAALVAAALDANWLRPGGYHGRALDQVDQLLLINNQLDPAMRFYHLALEGRMRPLGYAGPLGIAGHDGYASRVRSIDVTSAVGRHHALAEYLSASSQVGRVLEQVAQFAPPAGIDASLAERADARQQN